MKAEALASRVSLRCIYSARLALLSADCTRDLVQLNERNKRARLRIDRKPYTTASRFFCSLLEPTPETKMVGVEGEYD